MGWSDGLVVAVVVFGLWRAWPVGVPWPVFLDPSWYANTAAEIEATGGLSFPVPALADLPVELRAVFSATFRDQAAVGLPFPADAGRGFHNVGFAMADTGLATAATVPPAAVRCLAGPGLARRWHPWGLAWSVLPWVLAWWLAVGALARGAFGPVAAPVAVGLVALGPAAAYFGSQPYAEPAAAALVAVGTWCLVRLAGGPARPGWAAAAGLALGLAAVVKVDAAVAVAVGAGWWLAARWRAGGWREGLGLAAGLALPALQLASLALGASGLYLALNGGGVLRLVAGRAWLLAVMVLAGGALAAAVWWARRSGRLDEARARRAVGLAVAALVALALVAGWLAPDDAAPNMVTILAWLVTPLGLWAAVAGLVLALEAAEARTAPVLALALVATPLVLLAPVVSQAMSVPYIARRLLPVALTVTAVLAGAAMTAWWGRRAQRAATGAPPERWQDGAVLAAVALVAVGLVSAGAPLWGLREFQGGETLARRLARHVAAGDVLCVPLHPPWCRSGADGGGRVVPHRPRHGGGGRAGPGAGRRGAGGGRLARGRAGGVVRHRRGPRAAEVAGLRARSTRPRRPW